ncbi:hypothetical protein [Rhodanobacter soli]
MAGEGTLQVDPTHAGADEQYNSEKVAPHRSHGRSGLAHNHTDSHAVTSMAVDAQRLDTAVRILQSELSLANSPLSLSDNTDLLTQLYEMLGPGGSHVDPLAMVTFNQKLAERIRKERDTA